MTERTLTPRGRVTRDRIVESAAGLMYAVGIQGTSNDLVRKSAGVSGSQLSHYFPDKQSLVGAVLAWRADSIRPTGDLSSMSKLRAWADSLTNTPDLLEGGCTFGSLASEALKSDLGLRDDVAAGFAGWRAPLRAGLLAMRERGELRPDADPDQLADSLTAAFQGGVLLAQAGDDQAPLRNALDAALAHVESFAAPRRPRPGPGRSQ